MSRQYDEAMEGHFDFHGQDCVIIQPEDSDELEKALTVKAALELLISELMHDEDSSFYESLLQEQHNYIKAYAESIGEFDNSTISSNIKYLCKKYGMRIGELEGYLDISSGYISRTLGENSKKKISIDIVWKIAQMFGTDIKSLTERRMWASHRNTELVERFIDRLYADTRDNYLAWEYGGGGIMSLEDRFEEIGLVSEKDADDEGQCIYHPDHLNPDITWIIPKDIMFLECFDGRRDLVIIPYEGQGHSRLEGYDFIFVWEDEDGWEWEKVFYSSDDPYGYIKEKAATFYDLIESAEFDAKLTPKIERMITDYVEGGRPE